MIQIFNRLFRRARDIGADEYEQLSLLRRTNMSEVWLARRKGDGLITVTKIARVDRHEYTKANQEAISNESRWLQKFQGDPRIVQIYRTGVTTLPGNPRFIAAEYLAGGTVEDLLDQKSLIGHVNGLLLWLLFMGHRAGSNLRPPNLLRFLGISENRLYKGVTPVEQALEIIEYIAEGLDHMHRKGVVHRDIKPDNIMFRRRPKHGQPIALDNLVLIDLGITAEHNRVAGAAIARGWSEPVRIKAREARKALVVKNGFDIYCLGQVLRYLLTRKKPHQLREEDVPTQEITPDMLRTGARLTPEDRIDLAAAITKLLEDCSCLELDDRPSAREVVQRVTQMLNVLNESRQLLGGPVLGPVRKPGPDFGSTQETRHYRRQRRPAVSFRLLAAMLTIVMIIAVSGLWLQQNGTNAIAQILPYIIEQQDSSIPKTSTPSSASESVGSQTSKSAQYDEEMQDSLQANLLKVSEDSAGLTGVVLAPDKETQSPSTVPQLSIPTVPVAPESTENTAQPSPNVQLSPTPQSSTTLQPSTTPQPSPTRMPAAMVEPSPTPEPSPTRKQIPTQASTSQTNGSGQLGDATNGAPIRVDPAAGSNSRTPQTGPINGLSAQVSEVGNSCSRELDTWDERVELNWTLEPPSILLPATYAQEVVIWRPGANPMDPNQAFTIHGRNEIIEQEGTFTLQRKPGTLIPAVIQRNEEYIWGILLVNRRTGARYQRLTASDCRFRPAGRLFRGGQAAGGDQ